MASIFKRQKNAFISFVGTLFLLASCVTRPELYCPRPKEYRGKAVATLMAEAMEIVRQKDEKRAIAFTLYGNKQIYWKGAVENILLAKDFYPGWDIVVFVQLGEHKPVPAEAIDLLKSSGAIVVEGTDFDHAATRFFIVDREYDRFISRDADSRIYPREIAAVADWIRHDWAVLHGMRDARANKNPLLAGMWGGVVKPLREKLKAFDPDYTTMEALYKKSRRSEKYAYGDDEAFLRDVVLKAVGEDYFISHESYQCHAFKHSRGFPIPQGISNARIGSVRYEPF